MTGEQLSRRQQNREIAVLRRQFEDVQAAVEELADALEAGEADPQLVAETYRQIAASMVSAEDAAHTAGVIDADAAEWRAINDLRGAMHHAADAFRLEAMDGDVISPTARSSRNAAISDATAAAEYLELARDGETPDR